MLSKVCSCWTSGVTLRTASFFTNLQTHILGSDLSQCVLGTQSAYCIILADELALRQRTRLLTLCSAHTSACCCSSFIGWPTCQSPKLALGPSLAQEDLRAGSGFRAAESGHM